MEYSEQEVQTYPLTRAYIHFLTALLPQPASPGNAPPSKPRLNNTLRRGTAYIFDRVLLAPNARRYGKENERWDMLDAVFGFMEKALLAFDMSELLSQANVRAIGPIATALSEEPGFLVLLRLLSESDIFAALAASLETVAAYSAPPPYQIKVLLRVLRIYQRILDIQLVFSDILLLTLVDPARGGSQFRRPLSLQSLDHHLLNRLSNVNAIALLVGDDNLTISFFSTKIITALCQSPVFSRNDVFRGEYTTMVNRLAGIMDASDDSIRIAQGFCTRLEADSEDLSSTEMKAAEEAVLRGASTWHGLPLIIRSMILDLLLDGTAADELGPNLAHFLLGFEFKAADFGLQDARASGARLSCLHVIIRQLAESSFFEVHPVPAAKSSRLVNQLFSQPLTGRATMRYTGSIVNFSSTQLASMPSRCPAATRQQPDLGTVTAPSGTIWTSSEYLVAYLDNQRWIISSVALDSFAFEGHSLGVTDVAELLFEGVGDEDDSPRAPLIIDLLSNIDISWKEETSEDADRVLEFFSGFDFDQFKRLDVDWWDLEGLERSMRSYRRHLEKQGAVSAGNAAQAMTSEAAFILRRLGAKNRETDISLAKGNFLASWNEALKVSLAMLFRQVPEDRQEVVLFELLDALFARFEGGLAIGVLEILCEAVLVVVTTLVSTFAEFEGVNLPFERLASILQSIIEAATRSGTTESARGNLYAAISQYLQLLGISSSLPDDASAVASSIGRDPAIATGPRSLHRATLAVLTARKDRLLPLLCRDAVDDRDVWKTECFALLGGIVSLCQTERDRQIIAPLTQGGFLPLFVRSLKDREVALQECLIPEPENLHAFWVYESKIALLLSLAATRKGAEELLDAGVFEVFSMCGFMTVQPFTDDVLGEASAMETVQRQHRVFICGLQLLARTLSSLHRSSRSGAGHVGRIFGKADNKGISFLNAHRETILLILRENQQAVMISGIEECRLIISILAMVVHKVPTDDLRSPSGFGAFHLAVLSVAALFFDRSAWADQLAETDERGKVESHVLALNQLILAYLCATTTGLKCGSGFPAFVTGAQRSNSGTVKYIASAPSLHMAVTYLSDLAEDVQDVSNDFASLTQDLQEGGEVDEEKLRKVRGVDLGTGPLSLEEVTACFAVQSQVLFNMIESLLLLIWRHLLFYTNDIRGGDALKPDNLSQSFSRSHLGGSKSAASTGKLLERVAAALRGTLRRVEELDISSELQRQSPGGDWGGAYCGMLMRRLNEMTAGLTGKMEE